MKHFARMGEFIVTAQPDGTITLNALIAAELAPGTDFPEELVRQANAAPDMLAALEKIADEIPRCQGNATGLFAYARGWLELARAAIAKAKGGA